MHTLLLRERERERERERQRERAREERERHTHSHTQHTHTDALAFTHPPTENIFVRSIVGEPQGLLRYCSSLARNQVTSRSSVY